MSVRKLPLFIGLLFLFLAILACTINIGGPAYPNQRIPVSTEAAAELLASVQTAVAAGDVSGQVTMLISEPQLTSYLASKLQAQAQPLFTDPQVFLRDGQIQIYGMAQQGYFQATVEIVLTAGVDEQGQLKIELTSADFGPLPVPADLKAAVTAAIQEAFTGAVGPAAVGFRLESITVADGTLTIVGRTK
jgi:hypothetical protein